MITMFEDEYKDCAWVSFDQLESFMADCLVYSGVPLSDAGIIADVLIESDKRGIDSHGIGRLKPIYIDRIDMGILDPVTNIDILKDDHAIAVLDANNGMGHIAGVRAMEMAISKAAKYGIGMTAVRNSSHYGIAGYYATMAVDSGMIGITGTNARPSIAPTFGVENMLGTNPLTFGIPTDEEFPFVLDCATSISQRGKIEVLDRAGEDTPEGWVIGQNGEPLHDTHEILANLTKGIAALAPLGGVDEKMAGYKGYGYATVVEIFCAALQNGSWMKALNGIDENKKPVPYRLGHFFIAIDPEFFMGIETFKMIAGNICRELRASKKAPGHDRIYTAGEKEWEARKFREKHGCPIPKNLQKVIKELCDRWKLDHKWEF